MFCRGLSRKGWECLEGECLEGECLEGECLEGEEECLEGAGNVLKRKGMSGRGRDCLEREGLV